MQSSRGRSHRKRISFRLSSDTTGSLPSYNDDAPSDEPPDYPDSAEEADEDTDNDDDYKQTLIVSPPPPSPSSCLSSPRRSARRLSVRKQRHSSLDALLERSVHALEVSNTLLQSSMSTQSSLSGVLTSDSVAERSLEERARGLSSRIRSNREIYDHWVHDLDRISKGVEGLLGDEGHKLAGPSSEAAPISSSLPSVSEVPIQAKRHKRRPSLDLRQATSEQPGLHLSHADRDHLISPPPRALTQFVSSADPESFDLPSTVGLRTSGSSSYSSTVSEPRRFEVANTTPYPNLHSLVSLPVVTDRTPNPSTPAYNMLSSFVARTPPSGSSTRTQSARSSIISSKSHGSSGTKERRQPKFRTNTHLTPSESGRRSDHSRSRSPSPLPPAGCLLPTHRCTPILEHSPSSSSDDSCRPKLTIQSLRKILDEQPPIPSTSAGKKPERLRPPAFLPRSPPPLPSSSTSTATASISRLYTKATHTSSTHPPPPPRSSAMKHPSAPPSPSPRPTNRSLPNLLTMGVTRAVGDSRSHSGRSSSGRSTPKRISFAELPESYASSRPAGSSSRFSGKKNKRKGGTSGEDVGEGGSGKGWWASWLVGAVNVSGTRLVPSTLRPEERVEERVSRGWGSRVFGSSLDDWAV